MDQHTRAIYKNRIIDLERSLRQITVHHTTLTKSPKYLIVHEKKLAFRYHIKHRELTRIRELLEYSPPRKEPAWVRKHTEDSIVQYIATGE